MSFDLTVSTPNCPADLKTLWEQEFLALGFDVEIYPEFSPESWEGGFLPFRVTSAPESYLGLTISEPALSGFEIDFAPDSAWLHTAMGRTTAEFAPQCLGAALHAKLCGGEYVNPQNGLQHSGVEAVEAAKKEIAEYLPHARKYGGLISHPFPGWEASR